jgi:hypothetical protein
MARGESSNNLESNVAIQVIESTLSAAADKLRNNPKRKKQIKIFGLNFGIAAADIITFSPGFLGIELFGASTLATAFGITIIFLSGVGVIYGNYRLLVEPDILIPTAEDYIEALNKQAEDYIEALNKHRGLKTFEEAIDLAIDQIVRLQRKYKNIMVVISQTFGDSEITCNRFIAAIAEMKNAFFMNIRSILSKLDAFDEIDFIDPGGVSQQTKDAKREVFNKYVNSIRDATEENEQILIMLDKLFLEITDITGRDSIQRDQMAKMIDELTDQLKHYRK